MSATVTAPDLGRWLDTLLDATPGLAIFDAHTHLGEDLDGTIVHPEALLGALEPLAARAVAFALHDPAGLPAANAAVLEAAGASEDRLVPFCRLDPRHDPVRELRRCLGAGARGIKLHPRAERFTFAHPGVEALLAVAHEERLPVLVHAGRGIAPLGEDLVRMARRYPGAPLILAHAAIADLAWLPEALDELPSVFFDTSWWNPADLLALFCLVPPGRILLASDTPYGDPALNAALTLRAAHATGLDEEARRAIAGRQLERLLDGEPPVDLGPAPGPDRVRRDVRLERVMTYLVAAWGSALAGGSPAQPLELARQALALPAHHALAPLAEEIRALLDLTPWGPGGLGSLSLAAMLAATPFAGPDAPAS